MVGSGLLGRFLAAKPDRRVVVITRQRKAISKLNAITGVVALDGDLTHPRLGLDANCYFQLQSCITEVVHCAADTRFNLPLDQARAVNTGGTRNILALARLCRRLEKFAHISTAYIAGRSPGIFAEAHISHCDGFCNTYQQSKYEAEELVIKAMDYLPAAILRLSSIIGDSKTGQVRQFNHVHQLLRFFPRNVLPVAPGEPQAPVDLIPTDWAVPALAFLFDSCFVPGRVYHICAGSDRSFTVPEMIDSTIAAFESHPIGRTWLPIRIPEFVSLSRYEEFVKSARGSGDKLLNEVLRVLGYFLPHLGIYQAFENALTLQALAPSGLELPDIRNYYGKVISYCLETNWGRQLGDRS